MPTTHWPSPQIPTLPKIHADLSLIPSMQCALSFGLMLKSSNCRAIKKGKALLAGKELLDNTQREKKERHNSQAGERPHGTHTIRG